MQGSKREPAPDCGAGFPDLGARQNASDRRLLGGRGRRRKPRETSCEMDLAAVTAALVRKGSLADQRHGSDPRATQGRFSHELPAFRTIWSAKRGQGGRRSLRNPAFRTNHPTTTSRVGALDNGDYPNHRCWGSKASQQSRKQTMALVSFAGAPAVAGDRQGCANIGPAPALRRRPGASTALPIGHVATPPTPFPVLVVAKDRVVHWYRRFRITQSLVGIAACNHRRPDPISSAVSGPHSVRL